MGAHRRAARIGSVRRGLALHRPALLLLTVAICASAACGTGGDEGQPTIAVTVAVSSPTPRNTTPRDPTSAVVAAVQACREKDVVALQALVAGATSTEAIQTMFGRGTDVQLLSQSLPEAPEDSVAIDVTLMLTGSEGPEPVQRTWQLEEQAMGGWLFTTLPDCY